MPDDEEVRLVEITDSVENSSEVLPFRFTPDPPDVPFPSVVVLLSPETGLVKTLSNGRTTGDSTPSKAFSNVATKAEWAEAFRQQAWADTRAAACVQGTEPSVFAMLLQMAFEKLGKAALLRNGSFGVQQATSTHQAATRMMQTIAGNRRQCNRLGIKQARVRGVLVPMIADLENLNPAVARSRGRQQGPWLEYPWEDPAGSIRWPECDLPNLADYKPKKAGRAIELLTLSHHLCDRLNNVFA